ncbi:gp53-like domain-containing protein [Burkholderia glumae]|uniref:Phage tail protein n=2 Tax=Burkholderia glumae TaxID=337 RepID=A0AAQ0BSX0_BURGL|nr:hypothetical protein [Burkholderia glumae]ACR32497.1 bacteriophage tail fiber protein [Burkholderia glumae BGR1]AJY64257.1 putative gp52 [Burkholderia glumae LMG 2196 = ATCC 33617]MCM2484297.1 phage tail protein [Burkholderia glumae]MCM2509988.1 phage tail protein [Burkholderia glumae]MCM2539751.1 phage tail protein [Burkholderia glumae]
MDYTTSIDNVVHGGTGHRMHSDSIAMPTAWSGNDGNMVIWSLMEVLRLGGITGKAFNPDDPASYTRFRDALVATFAPFDSPAFRGSPQAPLAPQFDNTTRLATTSFVLRALGSFSGFAGTKADTTLTADFAGFAIQSYASASITVTLPLGATMPVGSAITFFNNGTSGSVMAIAVQGFDTITVPGNRVVVIALQPGETLKLMSRGSGEWNIVGGTAALKFSTLFSSSLAATGFQRLPTGYIEQWGSGVTDANGEINFVFPKRFPTACFNVVGNHAGVGAAMMIVVDGTMTQNGVKVRVSNDAGVTGQYWKVFYRAIGV